ncbi:MAG: DUF4136 domain-containing protein [Muribaculum sp.]|nr:DUF4136 domain-containing protein [Muribaculum sp.]
MKFRNILGMAFAAVAIGVATSGCSSYSLVFQEDYNPTELQSFSTFRIVTPKEGSLPPGMSMVSYYNIVAAIREQMVDRGYTEDPESNMLVNIGLTVREDMAEVPYTQTVQTGWSLATPPPAPAPAPHPGPGPGPRPGSHFGPAHNGMAPYFMYPRAQYVPNYSTYTQWVPTLYREGVLTVDMVDMANKTPLYTASVATILDSGDSQLQSLSGIAQAVKVLFSEYPKPMLKQYKK